jgi:hypothetical protein
MASTYITRTPSSDGNKRTWTFSAWFKKGSGGYLFGAGDMSDGDPSVAIEVGNTIEFRIYAGGHISRLVPTQVTRDNSAWYHYVVAVDTTQATSSNRVKVYINGTQVTSFSTEEYMSQNYDTMVNSSSYAQRVGDRGGGNFDGCMAHVHLTDGTAYSASTFGETDSVSGIWKPKTAPSVTYGTNGFFLKFENSAAMGTDSSGNSNNFTVSGTLTQNVDTPSNNFCTFNGVNPYSGTLSNGNLKMSQASYDYNVQGTLGMESGKYYWEYKIDGLYGEFGVCEQGKAGQSDPQANIGFYFLYNNGNTTGYIWNNATAGSQSTEITIPAFASGMIINLAYDADNKALYIGQNGTWLNSGDPTSGASKTGALITNLYPRFGGTIVPFCGHGTSNTTANYEANFGQGYFGTTAVASAGTAPSEGGIFEYNCPSGYQALCTKGINSF